MRIESHDSFGRPINSEVSRVVVYDDFGNPVLVALKYGPGSCYVGRIGDKDFNGVIKMLGINKTVILDTIEAENVNKSSGILIS